MWANCGIPLPIALIDFAHFVNHFQDHFLDDLEKLVIHTGQRSIITRKFKRRESKLKLLNFKKIIGILKEHKIV